MRFSFYLSVYVVDPALIRPGRVDLKLLIDNPEDAQILRLFKRFYPAVSSELETEFLKNVKNLKDKVSMACLQNLFIAYRDDAREAVAQAVTYLTQVLTKKNEDYLNTYI